MKAISIRQPWAWLIIRPDLSEDLEAREYAIRRGLIKNIENRTWPTRIRGRVWIHAAQGMTKDEYEDATDPLWATGGPTIELPPPEQLQRGGIIGAADIVDCVTASSSPWFNGPFGFVLINAHPVPFMPLKGKLGFFDVEVPA